MAIADTINSIRTHLETDYEALENIGAELENVDKNIENIASVVNGIYDNLPKTTGEDTNLSLNTLKGKMNIIPKGDTKQTQYSGKNVLQCRTDISIGQTGSSNGITWKRTGENTWVFNGTATADFTLIIGTNTSLLANLTTGETYTLSGCPSGGSDSTYRLQLYHYNTTGTAADRGSGFTFVADIQNESNVAIRIFNGNTANNLTFNAQIEKGSSKTSFEPYVGGTAIPNPSYPQDIEVVTGTQEVKVENVNLLPNNATTQVVKGVTITINEDKSITLNGTATAPTNFFLFDNGTNILKSGTYTLALLGREKDKVGIYINSSASTRITQIGASNETSVQRLTFTLNEDTTLFRAWIYFNTGTTLNNLRISPMIYKGTSTTTPYTPHQEQTQIVSLGDIELCKIGNYQDYLYKTSGKNYIDKENEISQGGTITFTDTTRVSIRVKKQLKANTTYTLITNLPLSSFAYAFVLGKKVSPWKANEQIYDSGWQTSYQSFTYTTTQDCYINIPIRRANGSALTPSDVEEYWFMLYEGAYDSSQPYEPYGSGIWYKKEQVRKLELAITDMNNSEDYPGWNSQAQLLNDFPSGNTNFYQRGSYYFCNVCSQLLSADDYLQFNAISNATLYLRKQKFGNEYTQTYWKTNFSSLIFVLYYSIPSDKQTDIEITNTSLIEQLDNLEKLKSYNGTTNINSNGNLPIVLNVSALKGE